MTQADHLATVRTIYEAFGRGDVDAILSRVSAGVSWDAWRWPSRQRASVPWLVERHGTEGVREFFGALTAALEFTDFRVASLLTGADKVAAEIEFAGRARATGRPVHVEELHLWSFDADGRVCAYRDYFDTALDVELLSGTDASS
jgi:ketosteroid isomerase-like protein